MTEESTQENELKMYHVPLANKYTVYITDVKEPDFYSDLFYQLANCTENDVFEFNINSHGGLEETAIQLYNAITGSRAQTVGIVSGYCCSAGTIILLACNVWQIPTNSKVMVHSTSGGIAGKAHETRAMSDFDARWLDEFFKDVYTGFLSKKEIQEVLEGKDMWFTGRETAERLQKYMNTRGKK